MRWAGFFFCADRIVVVMVDSQLATLRVYEQLEALREEWGGALVFSCGAEAAVSGVVPAASIAGAASLLVVNDSYELKKAFRRGEVDFIVNSLDEAVRALKNEVRQKRPLSVGLIADVDATVAEMVERGLQPDVFFATGDVPSGLQALISRGMKQVSLGGDGGAQEFAEYFIETKTPTKLREVDARLLRLMPKDEIVRRRWVERAAKYQRAATDGRWVMLSGEEAWLMESEGFQLRAIS